ncbi:MAG: alpha amylase N-terminal ig-like domain-containing protein, partial [Bacilli bacterium]|nr:alpha amylase N-terminal ig-like domain-containing protein [Bacilli bacterium]
MEKSAIIHKSDSIYSFPLNKNSVEIRLLTKKGDNIKKVELVYNDK